MNTEQAFALLRQVTRQINTNADVHDQITQALTHLRVTIAELQIQKQVTDITNKKVTDAKTG